MGCTREAIAVISFLSVDSIFFTPQDKREQAADTKKKFSSPLGDLITFLNVLNGYEDQKGNAQWCHQNFINKRNMKQVLVSEQYLLIYDQKIIKLIRNHIGYPKTACSYM